MFPESLPNDIRSLSIADRIELAAAIWDSIADEDATPPLTEAQRCELDRRLDAREADPNAGDSWEAVKSRLMSRS